MTPPCGTPFLPEAFSITFRRCMTSASSIRRATFANSRSCRTFVKVGAQVKVEDPRLPPDYRLGNSLDRIMSCPLGTISKRSRLEIRLEDRLEYELERPLHHSVADRRNREDADFAPVLRYLLPPRREWLVGAPDQFVP